MKVLNIPFEFEVGLIDTQDRLSDFVEARIKALSRQAVSAALKSGCSPTDLRIQGTINIKGLEFETPLEILDDLN
jgi:hypothetical protein